MVNIMKLMKLYLILSMVSIACFPYSLAMQVDAQPADSAESVSFSETAASKLRQLASNWRPSVTEDYLQRKKGEPNESQITRALLIDAMLAVLIKDVFIQDIIDEVQADQKAYPLLDELSYKILEIIITTNPYIISEGRLNIFKMDVLDVLNTLYNNILLCQNSIPTLLVHQLTDGKSSSPIRADDMIPMSKVKMLPSAKIDTRKFLLEGLRNCITSRMKRDVFDLQELVKTALAQKVYYYTAPQADCIQRAGLKINTAHLFKARLEGCSVGFHHDYMKMLERNSIIEKLSTSAADPVTGIWSGALKFNKGPIEPAKTLFPPQWTQDKVLVKIGEAHQSSQHRTKEGLPIVIVYGREEKRAICSAYPQL